VLILVGVLTNLGSGACKGDGEVESEVNRRTVELRWNSVRPHAVLLALVLGAFLLVRLAPGDHLAVLRAYGGMAILFLLPGFLLASLLVPRALDVGEILALSVALSVASLCLLGFLAFVFRWSLDALLGLTLAEVAGLLVALRLIKRRTSIPIGSPRVLFVLLIAIAFSVILFRIGAYQDGDAIGHLTWVRRLFERGAADQSAFTLYPGGPVYPPYSYNCWHLGLALIARLARVDPVVLWVHLSSFLVVPFIYAFWLLSKRLFESENAAFAVTLLYVGVEGVYKGMWIWRLAPYPDQVGKFLLIIGLFAVLEYVLSSRRRLLTIVGLTAFTLPLVHISAYTYYILLVASFTALAWIMRADKARLRRALIALAALMLAAAAIGAVKLYEFYTSPAASGIIERMFESHEFVRLSFDMYIVNPSGLLAQSSKFPYLFLLNVLALALVPLTFYRAWKTRKPWAVFLSAGVLGTVLYIFNPLIVTAVIRILGGNLASRAAFLIPFLGIFLVGFYGSEVIERLVRRRRSGNWYNATVIALFLACSLAVALIVPHAPAFRHAQTLPNALKLEKQSGPLLSNMDTLSFLRGLIPNRSAILSGGSAVASLIGPYFDLYTLPPSAGSDWTDAGMVLDPTTEIDKGTLTTLQGYSVKYILTQDTLEMSKLREYPELFYPVYSETPYTLYEVQVVSAEEASASLRLEGMALLEEGDSHEAAKRFRQAIELNPSDLEAEQGYETAIAAEVHQGVVALEQGMLKEAETAFLGVLQLEPEDTEVVERLAEVSERYFERAMRRLGIGDRRNAFLDLRRAVALDTASEDKIEALTELTGELLESQEMRIVRLPSGSGEGIADGDLSLYTPSREPDYWNPQGTELIDGGWDSTRNSVAWRLQGGPVAIDFDLKEVYPLHEISIKNTHFTKNYGQREWRIVVLVSEDGEEFSEAGEFAFSDGELKVGEHVWSLPTYMSGRYVRVLVLGESGLVTLGEVEIYGYVFPD
jgi:tetratricopeptide (TPR) repeat protein